MRGRDARLRFARVDVKPVALLGVALVVVVCGSPDVAWAQAIPESSLSALFPVGDTPVIWQVGKDSAPAGTDGKVAGLTIAGAVVGDFAALVMLVFATYDDGAVGGPDHVLMAFSIPVAVGGPVAGAAIAGGNVRSSFRGSLIGLAGGGLLGAGVLHATQSFGAGAIAFLLSHAVTASLFAIRPDG